ncbi:hypothetical protein ABW20_dc0102349 [Dactylellina cionopaga]|nr:hypothetical protein ABW20_dc0102349 [Dactylellina cionopaga]
MPELAGLDIDLNAPLGADSYMYYNPPAIEPHSLPPSQPPLEYARPASRPKTQVPGSITTGYFPPPAAIYNPAAGYAPPPPPPIPLPAAQTASRPPKKGWGSISGILDVITPRRKDRGSNASSSASAPSMGAPMYSGGAGPGMADVPYLQPGSVSSGYAAAPPAPPSMVSQGYPQQEFEGPKKHTPRRAGRKRKETVEEMKQEPIDDAWPQEAEEDDKWPEETEIDDKWPKQDNQADNWGNFGAEDDPEDQRLQQMRDRIILASARNRAVIITPEPRPPDS